MPERHRRWPGAVWPRPDRDAANGATRDSVRHIHPAGPDREPDGVRWRADHTPGGATIPGKSRRLIESLTAGAEALRRNAGSLPRAPGAG